MLIHLYVPTLQMIIEHDEAMTYIVEVMAPHHLCRSDIPLEFLIALHYYLGHAYM